MTDGIENTKEENKMTEIEEEKAQERTQQIADIRAMVDWLEQHPEVDALPNWAANYYYSDLGKEPFMAAVRAFGTFEKSYDTGVNGSRKHDPHLVIKKRFGSAYIHISIPQSVVCKKVKVMKEVDEWECEPLLSSSEMAEVETGEEAK